VEPSNEDIYGGAKVVKRLCNERNKSILNQIVRVVAKNALCVKKIAN